VTCSAGAEWKQAYVALGGNLGDVLAAFRNVFRDFLAAEEIRAVRFSSAFKTVALTVDGYCEDAPAYWNAVCAIETRHSAKQLLSALQRLELAQGRVRQGRWEERTLDLDILSYDNEVVSDTDLSLPHPRLAERNFVLQPFAEIAPDYKIPQWNKSVGDLLALQADKWAGIVEKRENWLTR